MHPFFKIQRISCSLALALSLAAFVFLLGCGGATAAGPRTGITSDTSGECVRDDEATVRVIVGKVRDALRINADIVSALQDGGLSPTESRARLTAIIEACEDGCDQAILVRALIYLAVALAERLNDPDGARQSLYRMIRTREAIRRMAEDGVCFPVAGDPNVGDATQAILAEVERCDKAKYDITKQILHRAETAFADLEMEKVTASLGDWQTALEKKGCDPAYWGADLRELGKLLETAEVRELSGLFKQTLSRAGAEPEDGYNLSDELLTADKMTLCSGRQRSELASYAGAYHWLVRRDRDETLRWFSKVYDDRDTLALEEDFITTELEQLFREAMPGPVVYE